MRITNNMLISNVMNNMYNNLERMNNINRQFSSGKKFSRPSDDPIGVTKSMRFHTDLGKLKQYQRNLKDAQSWMEMTEDSLTEVNDLVKRMRDIAVSASNQTNTEDELKAFAAEVEQKREQLVQTGNATYAGRYLFSGFKTDVPLLDDNGKYKLTDYENTQISEVRGSEIDGGQLDFTSEPLNFDIRLGGESTNINLNQNYSDLNALKTAINSQLSAGTTGITADIVNQSGTKGQLVFKRPAGNEDSLLIETPSTGNLEKLGLEDGRYPLKQSEVSDYNLGVSDDITVNTVGIRIFGKAEFDSNGKLIDNPNYHQNQVNGYEIVNDENGKRSSDDYADKSYMLAVVDEFTDALKTGDAEIIQKTIERFDGIQENILQNKAEIGAKVKRLELTDNRMGDENINFTELLSNNEDANMAQVYTQLKIEENIYNSSLAAGAKIIQPTLLDFLR